MPQIPMRMNVAEFVSKLQEDPERLKSERNTMSDTQFGKTYNVSTSTIVKFMGYPSKPSLRRNTVRERVNIEEANIKRLTQEDVTVAKLYGVSASALSNCCGTRISLGLPILHHSTVRVKPEKEVLAPVNVYKAPKPYVMSEQERLYEESWKKDCIEGMGSIDISQYK